MTGHELARMYGGSAKKSHKVTHEIVETVEYGAASGAFGYIYGKYRERAEIKGVPVDIAVGVVGKAVGLAVDLFAGHGVLSKINPHLHTVSNAGIGSFFHTMGAGYGAKSAGYQRVLIPPGAKVDAAKLPAGSTILGAVEKAPEGDYLDGRTLRDLARGARK